MWRKKCSYRGDKFYFPTFYFHAFWPFSFLSFFLLFSMMNIIAINTESWGIAVCNRSFKKTSSWWSCQRKIGLHSTIWCFRKFQRGNILHQSFSIYITNSFSAFQQKSHKERISQLLGKIDLLKSSEQNHEMKLKEEEIASLRGFTLP